MTVAERIRRLNRVIAYMTGAKPDPNEPITTRHDAINILLLETANLTADAAEKP